MGKDPKTTIEVNGKRYDTRTGKQITHNVAAHKPVVASKATVSDVARRPSTVSHAVHKATERSHTLMRSAVKKPAGTKVGRSKHMMDVLTPVKPHVRTNPGLHTKTDAERSKRATAISQSSLVSKFNDVFSKPAGQAKPALQVHPLEMPVVKRVEPLAVQPHPVTPRPAVTQQPLSHTQSVLAKGLQNANSHMEKPHKAAKKHSKHRRAFGLATSSLAVLLLAGFFALQNAPNLSVRYASARAGVHASMPSYHPSGFAVNDNIEYSPGAVTISFRSNSDSRTYDITQKSSNWNSDALMSNYVATVGDTPQKYEDKGRTIYLYGDSNATWVNGGVWYNITGASKLNSDQLIKIATSM